MFAVYFQINVFYKNGFLIFIKSIKECFEVQCSCSRLMLELALFQQTLRWRIRSVLRYKYWPHYNKVYWLSVPEHSHGFRRHFETLQPTFSSKCRTLLQLCSRRPFLKFLFLLPDNPSPFWWRCSVKARPRSINPLAQPRYANYKPRGRPPKVIDTFQTHWSFRDVSGASRTVFKPVERTRAVQLYARRSCVRTAERELQKGEAHCH